jgi:hypothetical protein
VAVLWNFPVRLALPQTLTYWAPSGVNNTGDPQVSDPVEYPCRWEDTAIEFIGRDGTVQISRARVFVEFVAKVGGVVYQGLLDSSYVDPKSDLEGAYEIRQVDRMTELNGNAALTVLYL